MDVPQRIEAGNGAGVTITWGDDRVDRVSGISPFDLLASPGSDPA